MKPKDEALLLYVLDDALRVFVNKTDTTHAAYKKYTEALITYKVLFDTITTGDSHGLRKQAVALPEVQILATIYSGEYAQNAELANTTAEKIVNLMLSYPNIKRAYLLAR